jgi:hypothetical protein
MVALTPHHVPALHDGNGIFEMVRATVSVDATGCGSRPAQGQEAGL